MEDVSVCGPSDHGGPFCRATGAPGRGGGRRARGAHGGAVSEAHRGAEPVAGVTRCPGYRVGRQECRRPRPDVLPAPLATPAPPPVLPHGSATPSAGRLAPSTGATAFHVERAAVRRAAGRWPAPGRAGSSSSSSSCVPRRHHAAAVEDDDLVASTTVDSRCATTSSARSAGRGATASGAAAPRCGRPGWRSARRAAAGTASRAATGAMASRCRSPPESSTPSSPTGTSRPARRPLDHRGQADVGQHRPQLGVGRARRGQQQVVAHRPGEHRRLLLDVAEPGAQRRARQLAHVGAGPPDRAGPSG